MTTKIATSDAQFLDAWDLIKNWRISSLTGLSHRVGNSAAAINSIVREMNNALSRNPRANFARCQPLGIADTTGADPLFVATYYDGIENARTWRCHIIAVPRTYVGAESSWAYRTYNDRESTPATTAYCDEVDAYEDVFETEFTCDRGDRAAGEIVECLTTLYGFTALAVTFEDEPLTELDTSIHQYADPLGIVKGGKVIEDNASDIYGAFEALRLYHLPSVVQWSAAGMIAEPDAPGDDTCITVISASLVNVLDQTVTARTADTPGWCCDRYKAGTQVGSPPNSNVTCTARVYAEAIGGDGTVRFVGPEHTASNYTEITVPAGGGLNWYGAAENVWYLNADAEYDDATVNCNKTDVLASCAGGGTLYIRALAGWQVFP